ncbi:MAG: hypothetical protein COX20_12085, partial [Desulfobacterales bacterium CG23_combo_of_CG06-09_8_20_14_all_52_9]
TQLLTISRGFPGLVIDRRGFYAWFVSRILNLLPLPRLFLIVRMILTALGVSFYSKESNFI